MEAVRRKYLNLWSPIGLWLGKSTLGMCREWKSKVPETLNCQHKAFKHWELVNLQPLKPPKTTIGLRDV